MTKEYSEAQSFEDWKKTINANYCYLLEGAGKTYAGILVKNQGYIFRFENMNKEEALAHIKFQNLRTNLNEDLNPYDKEPLEKCKKLCEKQYKKDIGLGYQVQQKQGRL